jgi:hypothetical protein
VMLRSANHCKNSPFPYVVSGRHRFWFSSLPLRETCEHVLCGHGFLTHARDLRVGIDREHGGLHAAEGDFLRAGEAGSGNRHLSFPPPATGRAKSQDHGVTRNTLLLVNFRLGVVTVTLPVVAPAGTFAVR